MTRLPTRPLVEGAATGPLVVLEAPLSLWGGLDVETGSITDVTHPQYGLSLANSVLAMVAARGSSSSSSVLVEAARRGTAPKAIILTQPDAILTIGSLVADDLYNLQIPILLLATEHWPALVAAHGREIAIKAGGTLILR